MLFNSIEFAIFLPIVFGLYWAIPKEHHSFRNILILAASYLFYGWWDWRFLGLIAFSSIVDFYVGRQMHQSSNAGSRKLLLILSLSVNLGLLGFFKYFNFFVDSFVDAFQLFGQSFEIDRLAIVLPVGISFYTFQTLSYTIDIYRKNIKPEPDPVAFFAFVSFFPQLVAGPIERASHLLPQFSEAKTLTYNMVSSGFKLMVWGFFLKLVMADRAGIYVDAVYNNVAEHNGVTFAFATVLFAFQIYGDFAGYSLIAIGTARLFGFDLMWNFNRPYLAKSVKEFWGRWHISLSTWFRDYLYIPLGGNRVSQSKLVVNLLTTFTISGLWHGANWTFVVWGAINGFYLVFEHFVVKDGKRNVLRVALTFVLINLTWVFFRAGSIADALHIIHSIFTDPGKPFIPSDNSVTAPFYALLGIGVVMLREMKSEYFPQMSSATDSGNRIVRMVSFGVLVFAILYLGVFDNSQFIYFQF